MGARRVLVALGPDALTLVRESLGPEWTVDSVAGASEVWLHPALQQYDLLVLDPLDAWLIAQPASQIARLTRRVGIPTVLAVQRSAAALSRTIDICRRDSAVYWMALDQDAAAIRETAEHACAARLAVEVMMAVVSAAIRPMAPRTLELIREVFRNPVSAHHVDAVLAMSDVTSTTVNSDLRTAGLRPFREIREAARLAHAHPLLGRFQWKQEAVARAVGAGSVDSLERACRRVFGISPGHFGRDLRREEVIGRLVGYCMREEPRQV